MPKATVKRGRLYFYEEGEFTAILRSVEENTVEYTAKSHHQAVKKGEARVGDTLSFDQWIWTWDLLSGDHGSTEIEFKTNPGIEIARRTLGLQAWEALTGEPLELGQDIDTDVIVGGKARLVIVHEDPETGRDGNTYYRSRVGEVLPLGDSGPAEDEIPF